MPHMMLNPSGVHVTFEFSPTSVAFGLRAQVLNHLINLIANYMKPCPWQPDMLGCVATNRTHSWLMGPLERFTDMSTNRAAYIENGHKLSRQRASGLCGRGSSQGPGSFALMF